MFEGIYRNGVGILPLGQLFIARQLHIPQPSISPLLLPASVFPLTPTSRITCLGMCTYAKRTCRNQQCIAKTKTRIV
jgi:hypothetical protein